MSMKTELRSLPWLAAAFLVLFAVVVLLARVAGLLVVVLVDGLERTETVIASVAGVSPWGCRIITLPVDATVPTGGRHRA